MRNEIRAGAMRLFAVCLLLFGDANADVIMVKLAGATENIQSVEHLQGFAGQAMAVNLTQESGGTARFVNDDNLQPGLYRVSPVVKLHLPAGYDHSRLWFRLRLLGNEAVLADKEIIWTGFDWRPDVYTAFPGTVAIEKTAKLTLEIDWRIDALPANMMVKNVPAAPVRLPAPGSGRLGGQKADLNGISDILGRDMSLPLENITYPALLVSHVKLESLSQSVAVIGVHPAKVHVYPGGEENPVRVELQNFSRQKQIIDLGFSMVAGLESVLHEDMVELTVPAGGKVTHTFPWKSTAREYGHGVRIAVRQNGTVLHQAEAVFSVSSPVWKTAIQGSGFITWGGREHQFEKHVHEARRHYINVEEAFSWQPSSWTDLTPQAEEWWTGQNNYRNTLKGLKLWRKFSQDEGIKLISYLWSTASGPQGLEWARQFPELITHQNIGLGSEFHDVEDLRLYELTRNDRRLWDYQYGVWHAAGINRGYLKSFAMAVDELVASARSFGWDGVRFDCSMGWGAMDAGQVHAELQALGADRMMEAAIPEYYEIKEGQWDATGITLRNMIYVQQRLRAELGAHFAVSNNAGPLPAPDEEVPCLETTWKFNPHQNNASTHDSRHEYTTRRYYLGQGNQVNQEYVRHFKSWEAWLFDIRIQAERARQMGGCHMVQAVDKILRAPWVYLPVYTYAAGSHPYAFGFQNQVLPGEYNRFVTRYGEYCWSRDFLAAAAGDLGFELKAERMLQWQPFVRQRRQGSRTETVIQIISPPTEDSMILDAAPAMQPWQENLVLSRKGGKPAAVWLLTAEPEMTALRLPVTFNDEVSSITVPVHRIWSMIVWVEETP